MTGIWATSGKTTNHGQPWDVASIRVSVGCQRRFCSLMVHPVEAALHAKRLGKAEVRQESLVAMRGLLQHPRVMWVRSSMLRGQRHAGWCAPFL